MAATLGELLERFQPGLPDLAVAGDPATVVHGVCALSPGEPGKLAFLANPRLREQLASTAAAAVIVRERDAPRLKGAGLIARDPHLAFARIASAFDAWDDFVPGIDPRAAVAQGVRVPATSHVGAGSAIAAGVTIGEGVRIGPNCTIGAGASIGDGSRLEGNVWIGQRVQVGKRARLGPGAVLGYRGFGLARGPQGWEEVPQLGTVIVGDDVEIGACTTVDRGAIGDTVLEDGVKLDNNIQVAHNVRIGQHTAIASNVGIAGSTRIGARCIIAGAVGVNGHIEICDDVVITGGSMVTHSLTEKGTYGAVLPIRPSRAWRREVAVIHRLPEMLKRMRELEARLGIEHQDAVEDGGDQGGEPNA